MVPEKVFHQIRAGANRGAHLARQAVSSPSWVYNVLCVALCAYIGM